MVSNQVSKQVRTQDFEARATETGIAFGQFGKISAADVVKRYRDGLVIQSSSTLVTRIHVTEKQLAHCQALVNKASAEARQAAIEAAIVEETQLAVTSATELHESAISTLYEHLGEIFTQINALKAEVREMTAAIRKPFEGCESVEAVHALAEQQIADEVSDETLADERITQVLPTWTDAAGHEHARDTHVFTHAR